MSTTLGKALSRVEGIDKVTGRVKYTADVALSGLAYGVIFDSAIAKGRVVEIDTSAAEGEGVLAIITHLNAPKLNPVKMFPFGPFGETLVPLQEDTIYHAGQHLGIVVAETLERATEAAAKIKITYENHTDESTTVSIDDAIALGQKLETPTGFFTNFNASRGNFQQGLAEAEVKVEATYSTQRIQHNPIELSATTAVWDDDNLTLYDTTQWLFGVRNAISSILGMPQEKVRVISHYVGGGFGCKCFTWWHVVLAAIAAKQINRPVQVSLTRKQMFTSVGYRTPTSQEIILGATKSGKLTAIFHRSIVQTPIYDDYPTPIGQLTPMLYSCANLEVDHQYMRINASTPTQMRAPGEAPGTFALESAMDELAYTLDIDPLELRLRNYAESKDPESDRPWSSKHLKECYQVGAAKFGWSQRNPEPGSMQKDGMPCGWGMATAAYPIYQSPAAARVKIFADGRVVAQSGSHEIGTGTYTVMTQIAAEALGVEPAKVKFELGDTKLPKTPITGASRTVGSVGPAVRAAAEAARQQVVQMAITDRASPLHGYQEAEISVAEGHLYVTKDSSVKESYQDILTRHNLEVVEAYKETLPRDADQSDRQKIFSGLNALRGPIDSQYAMYVFGAYFVEVTINPVSGEIQISRVVGAIDAGRILNPKTATSQILGGLVMGIGMTLFEETNSDRNFACLANANLWEYYVPLNLHINNIETYFIDKPDPHTNPLGTKSVGEIGTVGISAAIANAVYHATGKRIRDLPLKLEKLL